MNDLQPGDIIRVTVSKSDGSRHRSWDARLEEVHDDLLVAYTCVGDTIRLRTDSYRGRYHVRSYYWPGRCFTLSEFYYPDGSLALVYSDICSPLVWEAGEVSITDLELDVEHWTGQTAQIVDQDEFAEAVEKYGYSAELQERCQAAAKEALELVRGWRPKGFNGGFRQCP